MTIGWGYERSWIGWFVIPIASIFIRSCYLQYTSFLSMNDKELVFVSPVISVHTLRKKREIKIVLVLSRLPSSLVPWRSLHWINGWSREKKFWEFVGRWKVAEVQRKGVLVGTVRMILPKSKGRIGRWKLPEVEEQIFGGDCRGARMHK